MSEEFRERLEAGKIEENIKRVDFLLGNSKHVNAQGLGIKLALEMTLEMSEGKALGAETGDLIATWMEVHPESIVEEAIEVARQFLLKPETLATTIGKKLFDEADSDDGIIDVTPEPST